METLLAALQQDEALMAQGAVLVQAVAHVPGWGEKNFQVGGFPCSPCSCLCVARGAFPVQHRRCLGPLDKCYVSLFCERPRQASPKGFMAF